MGKIVASLDSNLKKIDNVKYHVLVDAVREAEDPKGCFDDESTIRKIKKAIRDEDLWAWCMVTVRVELDFSDIYSEQYLGCCSYEGQEDFVKNSGYYDDMLQEALDDIKKQLSQNEAQNDRQKD